MNEGRGAGVILLDACCVLNLYAGRCIHDLLRALPHEFALEVERGAAVATDDWKALRLLASQEPPVPARTTLSLAREWSRASGVHPAMLQQVLRDIRVRARFAPRKDDPLRLWWEQSSQ